MWKPLWKNHCAYLVQGVPYEEIPKQTSAVAIFVDKNCQRISFGLPKMWPLHEITFVSIHVGHPVAGHHHYTLGTHYCYNKSDRKVTYTRNGSVISALPLKNLWAQKNKFDSLLRPKKVAGQGSKSFIARGTPRGYMVIVFEQVSIIIKFPYRIYYI